MFDLNPPPAATLTPPAPPAPPRDPLWLSALRGRMLAVLASALSLWVAAEPAAQAVRHLLDEGPSSAHVAAVMSRSTLVLDHADALLIALASLIALAAAGVSKVRSWWRHRA